MKGIVTILIILCLYSCGKEMERGVVINKEIIDGHYRTNYIYVGKVMVPQTYYIPTSYNLLVMDTIRTLSFGKLKVEEYTNNIEVSAKEYYQTNVGDTVIIKKLK